MTAQNNSSAEILSFLRSLSAEQQKTKSPPSSSFFAKPQVQPGKEAVNNATSSSGETSGKENTADSAKTPAPTNTFNLFNPH